MNIFSNDWSAWESLTFKDLLQEISLGVENIVTLVVSEDPKILKHVHDINCFNSSTTDKILY